MLFAAAAAAPAFAEELVDPKVTGGEKVEAPPSAPTKPAAPVAPAPKANVKSDLVSHPPCQIACSMLCAPTSSDHHQLLLVSHAGSTRTVFVDLKQLGLLRKYCSTAISSWTTHIPYCVQVAELLEKSKANKELNDRKRLSTSYANLASSRCPLYY